MICNLHQYHQQNIYEIIKHHYSDWEQPSEPGIIREKLMVLLGEGQYVAPLMELSEYHARFDGKTFLYM